MSANVEITGEKQPKSGHRGFAKGVSGNPAGRPPGARNRVTLAVEALLEGEAEALTRKAIERALEGDGQALRLCLDRIAPPRRDRPVVFALPALKEAADARDAFAAVVHAIAGGELTPAEGVTLAGLIADFAAVDAKTETWRRIRDNRGKRPFSNLDF
jgi:hypothetical protein